MARYLIPPTPREDLPPPPPAPRDFNVPDEAWGARLAFGALSPGDALDPSARQEAALANATRAAELQNQFLDRQRAILHTGPDAFLNRTGRDAMLGADDALARLDAARQETLAQAGNAAQHQMLREALGEHQLVEHATVGDHVGRQTRAWRHATAAARLDQLRQQAAVAYADPGSIEALHAASDSAMQEVARTRPRTGIETGASILPEPGDTPSIWRIAIDAALGKFDYPSSIVLHARAGDRLDPAERAVLDPLIAAAREHLAGQDYLKGIALPDTHDLDALDAAHQAATARNESDWPDTPSQRATNQHFIDVAFGTKKRDALKARAELDQAITDWLDRSASDGSPQTQRPPLPIWTRLDPQQQRETDIVLAQNARTPTVPADESPTGIDTALPIQRGRGTAPLVEPPSNDPDFEAALQTWNGRKVILPDGSTIPDASSPTEHLMSPFDSLADVAAAGRQAKLQFLARLALDPATAFLYLYDTLKAAVGQGGVFDYQRRANKNQRDGYSQLRQFRNVSNVNVGIFCQQLGLPLSLVLGAAGLYAWQHSSNWRPEQPYGLDPQTREFIELGYRIAESGVFGSQAPISIDH